MSLEDEYTEVRRVAAWLAAHGRPECRRRLVDVLDSGMADRAKLGVLSYEIDMMLEMPRSPDTAAVLRRLRDRLAVAHA